MFNLVDTSRSSSPSSILSPYMDPDWLCFGHQALITTSFTTTSLFSFSYTTSFKNCSFNCFKRGVSLPPSCRIVTRSVALTIFIVNLFWSKVFCVLGCGGGTSSSSTRSDSWGFKRNDLVIKRSTRIGHTYADVMIKGCL